MEIERYKMTFIKEINKELKDEIVPPFIEQKFIEEILSDNIRILGHDFVKNNKNKAKLIINNKKYYIKELINNKEFKNDNIKINMILSKDISNISYMFKNCAKLIEISNYDDIINIDDGEYLDCNINNNEDSYENSNEDNYNNFYNYNDNTYSNCSEIAKSEEKNINLYNSALNDIKNIIYQYNYYSNMSNMFYNCRTLSSLPDISEWKTDNVINMSYFFYNCLSLISLPDISKWNTNNVEDMDYIFSNCSSLSSLPDISKWNTKNVNDMSGMFSNCSFYYLCRMYLNGILIMLLI